MYFTRIIAFIIIISTSNHLRGKVYRYEIKNYGGFIDALIKLKTATSLIAIDVDGVINHKTLSRDILRPSSICNHINYLTTSADVIFLTKRSAKNVVETVNYRDWGINGITCTQNEIEFNSEQNDNLEENTGVKFKNNVIYTAGQPKGNPLFYFACMSKTQYQRIIFIDNERDNIDSVIKKFENKDYETHCFWLNHDKDELTRMKTEGNLYLQSHSYFSNDTIQKNIPFFMGGCFFPNLLQPDKPEYDIN